MFTREYVNTHCSFVLLYVLLSSETAEEIQRSDVRGRPVVYSQAASGRSH